MPVANINNNLIYFEDQGTGPAIIFLHGFPLDSRMWQDQRVLSGNYRVIMPDFRGFGQSTNGGPFTIRALAWNDG